jgi:hypothetical protein
MTEWLDICCNKHDSCKVGGPHLLPKYILDVSPEAGDTIATLRLYKSTAGEAGKYAALSYCWGGPQRVTLTEDTLESLKIAIDERSLPQTIKDAIKMTRGLNLRYLWIDALCIIQDSTEDKASQMPLMGNIYRHSQITFIASKAASVNDGFLNRTPVFDYSRVVTTSNEENEKDRLDHYVNHIPIRRSPQFDPIFDRAWAYQERILSPRTVVFAKGGMYWRCQSQYTAHPDLKEFDGSYEMRLPLPIFSGGNRSSDDAEPKLDAKPKLTAEPKLTAAKAFASWCRHLNNYCCCSISVNSDRSELEEVDGSYEMRSPLPIFIGRNRSSDDAEPELTAFEVFTSWCHHLNNYSSCSMSVDSDKLPAFSGLAERYGVAAENKLGRYMAGLWENFMIAGMRWFVQPAEKFRLRPSYRAPSWSWAAVNGASTLVLDKDTKLLARFIGIIASWKGEFWSYGEINRAEIIVRGPLLAVEMSMQRSEEFWGYGLTARKEPLHENDEAVEAVVVGMGYLDPGHTPWPNGPFYCLGLAYDPRCEPSDRIDGIILLRFRESSDREEYVRCGHFRGPETFQAHAEESVIWIC